jgi:hypothetical protein
MTTHYTPQAKDWSPAREADAGNLQGVIGYFPDTVSVLNGDVIQMVKIPLGAIVIDTILETGPLGTSVTAAVGDEDDADRYIAAADHSAAALTRRNQTDKVGVPYRYTAEDTVDVTIGGANVDDNIAVRLDVFYICGVDETP